MIRRPPRSTRTDTLFPYTTLFRSRQTGVIPEEVSNPDFELPEFVDEVLIAADQNAYFLAYNYSDNFHPGMTTMQMIELAPDQCRLVIKYVTLEEENASRLAERLKKPGRIGNAFPDKAAYHALKVYCQRELDTKSHPSGRAAGVPELG